MRSPRHHSGLDGVLLIDKPAGPTSHDVVARIRRALGESRIGHTGTLDPLATGLLVLVVGRATRLAAMLTAGNKTYDATLRLGYATTTDDREGEPVGVEHPVSSSDADIQAVLERFRGPMSQVPPAHSAKKIAGERAYTLARRSKPLTLAPSAVTVHALDWVGRHGRDVEVRLTGSAGFYVRSLARDVGAALGCGGHLAALRRIASGPFSVADAVTLDEAERAGTPLASRVIPPALALAHLSAVSLTAAGCRRARHGNLLGPEHLDSQEFPGSPDGTLLRVLAPGGELLAVAKREGAVLHPVVVLG